MKSAPGLKRENIFIFLAAIVCYLITLRAGHALDDVMVISINSFVKQGFKGIHGIFTKDSMYGYIGSNSTLTGGRYRPLSLFTFALEWQMFGDAPWFGHLVNILLYALTCTLLYKFLKEYIFKANQWLAFTAALLFTVHPIHTEVIANIKSRDELMSLLGSLAAIYFLFDYLKTKQVWMYLLSILCFFVALFAKENTITYLFVIPMALYLFAGKKTVEILRLMAPFILFAIVFIFIRSLIVPFGGKPDTEILNNPYLLATFSQKYGTIFLTLLYYLKLLIIPYPLSCDYSYNQIPFVTFTDYRVIISVILHFGMFIWAIFNFKKHKIISFSILYYIFTLSITSNLVFNIGAPMGERFLYMPSIGFSIFMAYLAWQVIDYLEGRMSKKVVKYAAISVGGVLALVLFTLTEIRNNNWRNDINLLLNDVKAAPNSAIANNRAGEAAIWLGDSISRGHADSITDKTKDQYYFNKSVNFLKKAVEIYPKYANAYSNLVIAYLRVKNYNAAARNIDSVKKWGPADNNLPSLLIDLGHTYLDSAVFLHAKNRSLDSIYMYLNKAEKYTPNDALLCDNFGGYYFTIRNFAMASQYWEKCLVADPQNKDAKMGLGALYKDSVSIARNNNNLSKFIIYLTKEDYYVPGNLSVYLDFGNYYKAINNYPKAREYYQKCLALRPGYPEAEKALAALPR